MHSIRFKTTAITVAAILLTVLGVFLTCFSTFQASVDRKSVETLRLIGQDTENSLEEYFVNIERSVTLAANMAIDTVDSVVLTECGVAGGTPDADRTPEQIARLDAYLADYCGVVRQTFESVASHSNGVITYYYCINPVVSETEHGFFYSRMGKAGYSEQAPLDARTLDPDDPQSVWYYQAVERGRPSWIGPYQAHFLEEIWTCSYVVPIYKTGTLMGVLGMDIPLETLIAQVRPIRVYDTGFASLCDIDGRIYYHPDPNIEIGTIPALADVSVTRELLKDQESGDTLIRYTADGEMRQMCFSTLPNGMKLVITAPVREINAIWLSLLRIVLLVTTGFIVLFAVISMLMQRRTTEPLLRLTAATRKLADGEYDDALDYKGKDEVGVLTGSFVQMQDEIRRYIADLNRRANTDLLTGLPNMRCFLQQAEQERKRLTEAEKHPAMLFFDLVGMKHFNSQYGFEEGDRLICDVGAILARQFGERAMCRYGDDHFAAVASEDTLPENLDAVFRACEHANGGNTLPIRVGVYQYRIGDVNVNVACDRAKYACDRFKASFGSGFYVFDRSMLQQIEDTRYIVSQLDRALEEHWIEVHYQPIVRAINGRICDEEALARWRDPVRGLLSPDAFIPVLESARLIHKLDLYVLDRVLEKIQQQRSLGYYPVPHSINLSRSDFEVCDVVEEVRKRVDEAGVARDRITIEITESIIGSDFDFMKGQVERFRALGFPVWMDDFGSGYSALDVLQSIEFDLIKFDMSFTQRLDEGENGKILLAELMKLANSLGLDTVCEGVESAAQVDFLREIGCSKLQGYYFSKPKPVSALLEMSAKADELPYENPKESLYYAAIGRMDLFDLSVLAAEEPGLREFSRTLPMAIFEFRDLEEHFVRSTQAYRDFMKHWFDADIRDGDTVTISTDQFSLPFHNAVMQCCENGERVFFDEQMADGSTVHSFVRKVAHNPVTGMTAVVSAILSISPPNEAASYAGIARALAADYYNIYSIDLDTDRFTEYTSPVGSETLAVRRRGEDFFGCVKRDALLRIYKDDQAPFLAVFSKENVIRDLDRYGVFTTSYRLTDTGTPMLVNMKITRLPGGNRIIMGISVVETQAP